MKKILITSVLSVLFAVLLFAQAKKKPVAAVSIKRGEKVFQSTCIACHQKDGGGVPRLNPPLIKTTYVLGDRTKLIQIVLKGLDEPIQVEGEDYTNAMPAQAQLSDQQVADVLTYVRNSFGNKASAVTIAQVKAVRAKLK
ncbi:MAG: cytochrome [Segetibacter sp.]|nr:cytochrome [Segetibacter sp.]